MIDRVGTIASEEMAFILLFSEIPSVTKSSSKRGVGRGEVGNEENETV